MGGRSDSAAAAPGVRKSAAPGDADPALPTLFISDLHLDIRRPDKVALFGRLLDGPARAAQALYILGDLFEVWLGDDDESDPIPAILAAMSRLTAAGVPLYVMHGNRDFLLGERFAAITGAELLPDPCVIPLYGVPALLMHGDTLCTKDVEYQKFRQQVRNPHWQQAFLQKPLPERRAIGARLRNDSQLAMADKAPEITDVDAEAVITAFTRHRVPLLIHGHTHRPGRHSYRVDGQAVERIVLGDWYEHENVLVCDQAKRELVGLATFLNN